MPEGTRAELLQAQVGQLLKENEQLKRDLNSRRPSFDGLSLEDIMEAIARGTITGDPQQIYALKVLLDRRPPEPNARQQTVEDDQNREWVTAQLARLAREEHRQWDELLRHLVDQGEMSESTALRVRELWTEGGDPEWKSGQDRDKTPIRFIENGANPSQKGSAETDFKSLLCQKMPQPNGEQTSVWDSVGVQRSVELKRYVFTDPHRGFWINGHGRIEANAHGEIDVSKLDETAVETLIAAGCRKRR